MANSAGKTIGTWADQTRLLLHPERSGRIVVETTKHNVKRERCVMMAAKYPLVFAALLLAPIAGWTAELPKEGSDTYSTAYVTTFAKSAKAADRSMSVFESSGITRNESGGAMFNNMGTFCQGMRETIGSSTVIRGTCVDADKDGDEIVSTYEIKNGSGTHIYVSGTGKYTGITGTATFTSQPIPSANGTSMVLVIHKATWKLP